MANQTKKVQDILNEIIEMMKMLKLIDEIITKPPEDQLAVKNLPKISVSIALQADCSIALNNKITVLEKDLAATSLVEKVRVEAAQKLGGVEVIRHTVEMIAN